MSWKVEFFETARGQHPVKEFMDFRGVKTATKIAKAISLLVTYGPFLKPPYMKKISDKLYELRVTGVDNIRVFYTVVNGEYYLLHAYKKESRKIPKHELKTAIDRAKELL